ncbi:MAG: SDR family oxidoreductase [Bacteroidota bacterium]
MRVLLTGATGYIAQRLLPVLLEKGHHVICCVREKQRFNLERFKDYPLELVEVDFLKNDTLKEIPEDIDVAYYLLHSMAGGERDFSKLEKKTAENFKHRVEETKAKQVIFLSGIVNEEKLSKHLSSRQQVEHTLGSAHYALTTLKAGIIVGSGSASFEIIRDLVEKLPIMIAPKWITTKCQPIAIRDVLKYLDGVMLKEQTFNKSYDIGGPEIITYKGMLLRFAKARNLKRRIWVVPVMTPKLSSYWLYFVTSTSYPLAKNLVESMKVDVVAKPNELGDLLKIIPVSYEEAIKLAFGKIEQNQVISSWRDAMSTTTYSKGLSKLIEVPEQGCFKDKRKAKVTDVDLVLNNIWSIGGSNGWYYADWLWRIRGFLDKVFGGVGLQRGRTSINQLFPGSVIDFWRVILADKKERRLLLYAEMKLPGDAWLEFKIDDQNVFHQTATFRPVGISGRLYWYAVLPFHAFIFKGMMKRIVTADTL